MRSGTLRHLPEPGGALEQDQILIQNMNYAVRTWQVDKRPPSQHTPEDGEWMREVVQPPRLKDGDK